MNLDNNYRIIADDDNFILQRKIPPSKKKRTARSEAWQNIGSWKDLGQALQSYSRRRRREGVMQTTLSELIELEHALSRQIEAIGEQCVSLWGKGSYFELAIRKVGQ